MTWNTTAIWSPTCGSRTLFPRRANQLPRHRRKSKRRVAAPNFEIAFGWPILAGLFPARVGSFYCPFSNFYFPFSGGGGRALIPKTAFGWRTLWRLVFQRVRSLTLKRRRGGRAGRGWAKMKWRVTIVPLGRGRYD